MEAEEKQALDDMIGFIKFGISRNERFGWVLANLGHDIYGFLQKEPGFSPRTLGYAGFMNREKEEKSETNDTEKDVRPD